MKKCKNCIYHDKNLRQGDIARCKKLTEEIISKNDGEIQIWRYLGDGDQTTLIFRSKEKYSAMTPIWFGCAFHIETA
jgi:hypothetical protein